MVRPLCGQPEVCEGEEADLIDVNNDKKPGGGGGGGGGGFTAPPAAMQMPMPGPMPMNMPMPMPSAFNYPAANGTVRDFFPPIKIPFELFIYFLFCFPELHTFITPLLFCMAPWWQAVNVDTILEVHNCFFRFLPACVLQQLPAPNGRRAAPPAAHFSPHLRVRK